MGRCGRTWPNSWTLSPELECPPLLPSALAVSSGQTAHMSAPILPFPFLYSSPTSPGSSHDLPASPEYTEGTLEGALDPIHTDVPVQGTRKRKLPQCVSPAPSKRQCRPSIPSKRHSGTNPTPPSDGCQDRHTDPDRFLQPTLQVPVDPDTPLNIDVFDWKSIWDPFAGTVPSICMLFHTTPLKPQLTRSTLAQPPVFHIPSSDLASLLLDPPDLGHDAKIMSSSSSDLGLLEDSSSLLQFPIPAGLPPDLSTSFAALPQSADSSPLQEFDSAIAEFIDLLPPGSKQPSTPLTSSSDPPTPPENSYLSLPQPQPCSASEQPLFELGSSVPPSAFLPFESGTFTQGVDDMFSLLCRES